VKGTANIYAGNAAWESGLLKLDSVRIFIKMKKKTKAKKAKDFKSENIWVRCCHDKLVPVGQLREHPMNPFKHPELQVQKLALLIKFHGWRYPIAVSRRSGLIVNGHCRLAAARLLNFNLVPVDVQYFKNEGDELAHLLADNVIQEFKELSKAKMGDALVELDQFNYPQELTAIGPTEAAEFINYVGSGPGKDDMDYVEKELKPYDKTHILISFPPEKFTFVEQSIRELLQDDDIEIEQASN